MSHSFLAFGVEPSNRKYRLRLARYAGLAETIASFVDSRADPGDEPVRLLDAGVGSGRVLRFLEAYPAVSRLELHAIDNDEGRIRTLYKSGAYKTITRQDLNDKLAYADDTFDIVVCEQVLEHMEQDPEPVIRELTRVLRPQGMLIIGTPTFPPVVASVRRWAVSLLGRLAGVRRSHVRTFTSRSLARAVLQAPAVALAEVRGFRFFSGGVSAFLENYRWWYAWNRKVGGWLPSFCVETQVIAVKGEADARPTGGYAAIPFAVEQTLMRWTRRVAAASVCALVLMAVFGKGAACAMAELIENNADPADRVYVLDHHAFRNAGGIRDLPVLGFPVQPAALLEDERLGADVHLLVADEHLAHLAAWFPHYAIVDEASVPSGRVYYVDVHVSGD